MDDKFEELKKYVEAKVLPLTKDWKQNKRNDFRNGLRRQEDKKDLKKFLKLYQGNGNFIEVLKIAQEKYGLEKPKKNPAKILIDKVEQAKEYHKSQPFFYDRNNVFWLWNEDRWEITDDTDLLNMIKGDTEKDIISSKQRQEIINALKQQGRLNIPLKAGKRWVQFKNKIIDLEKDEIIELDPKYLITNPIPWEIGENEDTPTIDRIFEEWVGEEYVPMLYEIVAYCLLPDYPIHRIFCLIGDGLNGKTSFLGLLNKFIGSKNITSSDLDILLKSRFESVKLYKKLICLMGETNFNVLSRTSILKRLTGQDLIGFEFKNKLPFDDENYAKIIIATNSLPMTLDKTIGFYRRWILIDFPNRFDEKKDILKEIPEIEYNNLAKKSIRILKELLKKREFTKEGNFIEKRIRFEEKSNPLQKFLKEETTQDPDGFVFKYEFVKLFQTWLEENKYRIWNELEIGRNMKLKYEIKKKGEKRYRAWCGLKFNDQNGGNEESGQDVQDVHLNPTQIATITKSDFRVDKLDKLDIDELSPNSKMSNLKKPNNSPTFENKTKKVSKVSKDDENAKNNQNVQNSDQNNQNLESKGWKIDQKEKKIQDDEN